MDKNDNEETFKRNINWEITTYGKLVYNGGK